jgi:hypothetical protein
MMIAETEPGTPDNRSLGDTGCLATWQCTSFHRIGSAEGQTTGQHLIKRDAEGVESLRESIERFIRPVCSGAM